MVILNDPLIIELIDSEVLEETLKFPLLAKTKPKTAVPVLLLTPLIVKEELVLLRNIKSLAIVEIPLVKPAEFPKVRVLFVEPILASEIV